MIEAVLRRSEGRLYRGYARVYVRRHGDVDDDFRTEISFIQDLVITEESIGYEDSYGQLHPIEVRSDCLFSLRQLSKEERKFLYHEAVLNAMDYRVVFYMRSISGEARLVRQYENQYISPILKQSGRSQYQVQLSMLFSPQEANEHFEIVEPPQSPVYVYPENDNVVLRSSEQVRVRVRVQVGGRLFLGVRVRGSVSVLQEWNEVADVMNGWVLSGVSGYLEKEFVYGGGESGVLYEFFGRVRYFNQDSFETTRLVCRRFSAPILSDYPTSIEYPTQTSFQVTVQRNTGNANNANANQVEFEWRIGVNVQGIVSAVYNNAGQATGTFQIPSGLDSGNTIFVKARSRNSVVIGEWSNEIEISVTLFRPPPEILSFSATTDKVALDAEPTEDVFFSLSFSYSDSFGGLANWQINRWDTVNNVPIGSPISSGVQTANPHIVPSIQLSPLPTVTTKEVITYRLRVFNPNGQSVHSDLTITFIPRPSLQYVRWFLNPNRAVYQGVSNTTSPANAVNNPVGSWYSSQGDTFLYVLQENAGNRPTIQEPIGLNGRRTVFCTAGGGRFLIRPVQGEITPSQTVFNDVSHCEKFTVIMVSNFTVSGGTTYGNVCSFKRDGAGANIVAFGVEDAGNAFGFRVGALRTDQINFGAPANKFGVVCVTYDADSGHRMKLYYNRLTLNTPFTPNAQSTVAGSLRAVADGGLGINARIYGSDGGEATGEGSNSRHIGHIIIFTKVLSAQEIVDWSEWLQAIYKFSTA